MAGMCENPIMSAESQLSVFMMCWLCRTIEDVDQLAKFKCADNVQICLTNLIRFLINSEDVSVSSGLMPLGPY